MLLFLVLPGVKILVPKLAVKQTLGVFKKPKIFFLKDQISFLDCHFSVKHDILIFGTLFLYATHYIVA